MAPRKPSTASLQGFSVARAVLDDRVCVVTVTGEVDVATAPDFRDALTAAVEDDSTDGIVVELSGVTFLDSTALTALVRCFEQQKTRLQRLSLVSNDSRVTALLEVTRLDRLLEVFATRDEAVARVGNA
jgi:anti-sigma B factor antagonist